MRTLVTGITGFAGGHLAEELLGRGQRELFGLARRGHWPDRWQHLSKHVQLAGTDLCDRVGVENALRKYQPDQIFHLAGYAHSGRSFQDGDAAWNDNLQATRTLYEATIRWGGKPRILYVSSGLVYGDPEHPHQIYDETSPLKPVSPYAASKAATDLMSYQYTRSPGLEIIRARPFNHIGPRQSPDYAVAHFARQISAIERKQQSPCLETGNLSPLRDFTDVRDVVQAYLLIMDHGLNGEVYNIASGRVHSIQSILDRLLALALTHIDVRQQRGLLRSTETDVMCGNAAKLNQATGWTPQINIDRTLADTLEYWRMQP